MTSETSPDEVRAKPKRTRALHLLWALPVVLAASLFPAAFAGLTVCGIWGQDCYPGGPGLTQERVTEAVAWCALAGLFMFAVVMLVPWVRRALVRLPFALAAGVGWTVAVWFYAIS